MDVKRFHPLLGSLDLLASNVSDEQYWVCDGDDWTFIKVFPQKGLVLLDYSFFENFELTLKIGTTKTTLKPMYVQELADEAVVFARGDTILFYDYVNSRWYVRFDGVPESPSNIILTDYEENKYLVGVPYLRGPSSLPSPILQGEYAEITLTNYLEPDDIDKECKLIIDPTNIGYYQKSSTTSIEGIYEGKLAYKGKRMRVGWGVWKDQSGEWVREVGESDGDIQLDGISFDDGRYIYGTYEDPKGWWEYEGKIEYEKDITFTFKLPPDSQENITKEDVVFTWLGFKVYSNQSTKKALQQKKMYVSESPVWR